jgi:hypothetical protein
MKKTKVIVCLLAISTLSQGCVGYNRTLFVTKTNVGLDMDTKPPTLEVSVARREGVIAPSFEDGKTPPVLASFILEPGRNIPLFPRISQTFAGGDTAVIMSTLYGSETPPSVDMSKFDSEIELSKMPASKWGMELQKPGVVRPLFFGTDTSFGLKVAWSGLTAQFPDTVKLGLNRKEFALAPVTMRAEEDLFKMKIASEVRLSLVKVEIAKVSAVPRMVELKAEEKTLAASISALNTEIGQRKSRNVAATVKMPSFLATIDNSSDISTLQRSGVTQIQYFATGDAADNLAIQQEVRRAMIRRMDPKSAALAAGFLASSGEAAHVNLKILDDIRNFLDKLKTDSYAQSLVSDLDTLGANTPVSSDAKFYIVSGLSPNQILKNETAIVKAVVEGINDFGRFDSYARQLQKSVNNLKKVNQYKVDWNGTGMPTPVAATPADVSNAVGVIKKQTEIREQFLKELFDSATVKVAVSYYAKLITGK